MFFIFGISQGSKELPYSKMVVCSQCGSYGRYQLYMTYSYFSLFFIPIFKWSRRYYVKMSCCGAVYELDTEAGRILESGCDIQITEGSLTLVKGGRTSYSLNPVKRCSNCGYETEEDFEYCPKCGQRL